MHMPKLRLFAAIAIAAALGAAGGTPLSHASQQPRIPDRIADSTYWRMITEFSEPSGSFPSENFVSNETEWQTIIPSALQLVKPGDVYLGVGPEQNFTYIAAFRPRIAFITDIRRQNLIQHLMYKALFELAPTRAEFLTKLFSRTPPPGLSAASTPTELVAAFARPAPDSLLGAQTLGAILDQLVKRHGFALTKDDSATIRAVFGVFFSMGMEISYSSRSRNSFPPGSVLYGTGNTVTMQFSGTTTTWRMMPDSTGTLRAFRDSAGVLTRDTSFSGLPMPMNGTFSMRMASGSGFATFGSLLTTDDGATVNRGWLATEANYQWLREFQQRNLLVPVVGNFGGDKALRAVGGWLKERGARVGAFYTSNVEQYLFQDGIAGKFYGNVATIPTDSMSIFIRSFPPNYMTYRMPNAAPTRVRLSQTISPIESILHLHRQGAIVTYADLARLTVP
jgi:hypothetical protein